MRVVTPEALSVDQGLSARLDANLPTEVAVGGGAVLFICGTCFHRDARIAALNLLVDGHAQPVAHHSMPRLDLFRSLHPTIDPFALERGMVDQASEEDPHLHSYLSGFWGLAEIPKTDRPTVRIELQAELSDGRSATVQLAEPAIRTLEQGMPVTPPSADAGPLVAICMATYEPPIALLRRQLDSIRAQRHANWVCVISDDCSSERSFAALEAEVADDPRFIVARSPRR